MPSEEADCAAVGMLGNSPAFHEMRTLLARMARCDASVLIEGETGTGKELAARAIHYQGARRTGPFVPINCGAIPDSLVESELFGYRRGAFTDAKQNSPGVLALADSGTLFLDEIDALSAKAQVTLLRFLQERKVRALGSTTEQSVNVRIIAASNRRLAELVSQGSFRRDLYYRLNVLFAQLPPLRARGGDVLLFAESMLRELARRHGRPMPRMSEGTKSFLLSYDWPGNVRELENLIEREFLLSDCTHTLQLAAAPAFTGEDSEERREHTRGSLNYRIAKARLVAAFDRRFLQKLMQECRGNVSEAARAAGKERRDLGRLLRKYAIRPESFRG